MLKKFLEAVDRERAERIKGELSKKMSDHAARAVHAAMGKGSVSQSEKRSALAAHLRSQRLSRDIHRSKEHELKTKPLAPGEHAKERGVEQHHQSTTASKVHRTTIDAWKKHTRKSAEYAKEDLNLSEEVTLSDTWKEHSDAVKSGNLRHAWALEDYVKKKHGMEGKAAMIQHSYAQYSIHHANKSKLPNATIGNANFVKTARKLRSQNKVSHEPFEKDEEPKKTVKEEVINELSREALGKYKLAAKKDINDASNTFDKYNASPEEKNAAIKHLRIKGIRRIAGIQRASEKQKK